MIILILLMGVKMGDVIKFSVIHKGSETEACEEYTLLIKRLNLLRLINLSQNENVFKRLFVCLFKKYRWFDYE